MEKKIWGLHTKIIILIMKKIILQYIYIILYSFCFVFALSFPGVASALTSGHRLLALHDRGSCAGYVLYCPWNRSVNDHVSPGRYAAFNQVRHRENNCLTLSMYLY